ncbi:hypothetical protein [Myxococcus virescens]|uniref:Uncharacterized protein n=1 Tax=Myxococcus virescens TaxID=83456 RepID=A0A511HPK0_9BACT|nr:hypothetical protein [Myxococcus virescens]GEL75521.1 hypothetical protein MVI01_73050 [Myxococcus virescens]SDD65622.1 hypothetical protein SAMN04488504_102149 [Myxococcus virescens]
MTGLAELVAEVLSALRSAPAGLDLVPFRQRALLTAQAAWDEGAPLRAPPLVNVAGLALAGGAQLVAHQVRPAAAQHVAATDLHSLPDSPPAILRRPWLLEVRRPSAGERLFGSTFALGGYTVEGVTYLVGLTASGAANVAPWRPQWTGGDLAEGTRQAHSPLIEDVGEHQSWARDAARFAVVYALLCEAEGSPLRVDEARKRDAVGLLPVRNVYLDGALGGGTTTLPAPAPTGSRVAEERQVRGHLKRQRHGPGLTLSKWIYVSGYSAWRWVTPGGES